ncbi:MAG: N-acetylmuramoyl-L-alanine amidase [Burkholderiales bacterium]
MTKPLHLLSHPTGEASPARRRLLKGGALALLLGGTEIARGASVVAVRIWPAPEYSRITIESDTKLVTKVFSVSPPSRLVCDITGLDLNSALRELNGKVRSDDPNIAGLRIGQFSPGVVRLVIDLKQEIDPEVFTLKPTEPYQHRLVFDLFPQRKVDPLDLLIVERMKDADRLPTPEFGHAATAFSDEPADPLGALMARQAATEAAEAAAAAAAAGKPVPPPPVVTARIDPAPSIGPAPKIPPRKPAGTVAAAKTDRFIVIALDPGHGGEDPGAIGPGGTHEKDVVLQIAHRLRDRINATTINGPHGRMGLRAYLTRDADFFVPLAQRVVKARKVQADLFVSIHADSFVRADASGASVYALSERGATSTTARWLANKENRADLVGGMNVHSSDAHLHQALVDMSTTAQVNDSLRLGSELLREIDDVGKLHKPRVEQAGFAVLKAPDIPSVLIETAFISNPDEERNLKSPAYQEKLADAVVRGITRYFSKNPPLARNRML